MELEETIKYIENIINATYITATLKDKDGDIIEEGLVNQQVIQDLLDLYNKEKKENNDLKENSIPKKKIENKIKELNEKGNYKTKNNPNGRVHFHVEPCDYQIQVLQELLEDK